jgi:dimeric dUTPase (all-alpha-NTP-PPase superfamily)
MHQKIDVMLALQDSMNKKVHAQWIEQQFAWYRAIWIECAELMDHYGWKWWKKQEPDLEQVKLEIIDIWHFGMSMMLQSGQSIEQINQRIFAALTQSPPADDLRVCIEMFVAEILPNRDFDLTGFSRLMTSSAMTFEDLYRGYIGKNVLNFFRQDHGYKDGSYKKVWGSKEDNEHLVDLVATLDSDSPCFKDDLYKALQARYDDA